MEPKNNQFNAIQLLKTSVDYLEIITQNNNFFFSIYCSIIKVIIVKIICYIILWLWNKIYQFLRKMLCMAINIKSNQNRQAIL